MSASLPEVGDVVTVTFAGALSGTKWTVVFRGVEGENWLCEAVRPFRDRYVLPPQLISSWRLAEEGDES